MLHAMSSRNVVHLALSAVAVGALLAPLALVAAGCDLKKDGAADAAVVATQPPAPPPTGPAPVAPPPAVTPVAPLGAAAPVPPGGAKPAAVTDGGKPAAAADAAAPAGDGGKPVPGTAPTPTLTFPTAIPGFDAGGFKPPPGFPSSIPSTLPTFPPPQK